MRLASCLASEDLLKPVACADAGESEMKELKRQDVNFALIVADSLLASDQLHQEHCASYRALYLPKPDTSVSSTDLILLILLSKKQIFALNLRP